MDMLYALAAPIVILPFVAIVVSTKGGLSALTTNVGYLPALALGPVLERLQFGS